EIERRYRPRRQLLLRGLEARLQIVEALVDRFDVGPRRDDALDREQSGDALDVVGGKWRERIGDGDGELLLGLREGDDAVFACERTGERAGDDVEVELERIDLDEAQAGELRQRLGDLNLRRESQLDDRFDDGHRAGARVLADALGLLARQRLAEHQDLQQIRVDALRRRVRLRPAGRR